MDIKHTEIGIGGGKRRRMIRMGTVDFSPDTNKLGKNLEFFLSFLLDRSQYTHKIIVVWWSSNTITGSIGILDSVPLMCLMRYFISHVFSSY